MTFKQGLIALALIGFGWACIQIGKDLKQGEFDATEKAATKARAELIDATANKLAAMAPKQDAITERVIREVKTNTVYRDCVLPDAGFRMLNDAIRGAEPVGGERVQASAEAP
mgnify:CR=1 FL=1